MSQSAHPCPGLCSPPTSSPPGQGCLSSLGLNVLPTASRPLLLRLVWKDSLRMALGHLLPSSYTPCGCFNLIPNIQLPGMSHPHMTILVSEGRCIWRVGVVQWCQVCNVRSGTVGGSTELHLLIFTLCRILRPNRTVAFVAHHWADEDAELQRGAAALESLPRPHLPHCAH